MRLIFIKTLVLLTLCAINIPVQAQERFPELPPPPEDPPIEVMLVGVFHFAQTDTTLFDALDPKRQAEIADLVGQLAAFEPTQVMVERQPYYWQDQIDSTYAEYRAGRFALPRNEMYQLGYRLDDVADLAKAREHHSWVVIDLADPLHPEVSCVVGDDFLHHPENVQVACTSR